MDFYFNLAIFYQNSPHFGGKLTSFVAGPAQNTCVCCYRLLGSYCSKVNIDLLVRFMKPGTEIMDKVSLQPHHFLPSQPTFWREMDKFCGFSGQNHLCVWL